MDVFGVDLRSARAEVVDDAPSLLSCLITLGDGVLGSAAQSLSDAQLKARRVAAVMTTAELVWS
jgi:hypothetical protein